MLSLHVACRRTVRVAAAADVVVAADAAAAAEAAVGAAVVAVEVAAFAGVAARRGARTRVPATRPAAARAGYAGSPDCLPEEEAWRAAGRGGASVVADAAAAPGVGAAGSEGRGGRRSPGQLYVHGSRSHVQDNHETCSRSAWYPMNATQSISAWAITRGHSFEVRCQYRPNTRPMMTLPKPPPSPW